MKKIIILSVITLLLIGCRKEDNLPLSEVNVLPELKIVNSVGIKLESSFVRNEVLMNVKSEYNGLVTIKIFDIANKIVSKEVTKVEIGDNILKVYTNTLPSSAYRIGLFDEKNNMLGITDFNKL